MTQNQLIFFTLLPIIVGALTAFGLKQYVTFLLKFYEEKMNSRLIEVLQEIEGKAQGARDNITAQFALIQNIQNDVALLNPDGMEEMKMRIENIEANIGLRQFGRTADIVKEFTPRKAASKPTA